jgi:hypothetical protein
MTDGEQGPAQPRSRYGPAEGPADNPATDVHSIVSADGSVSDGSVSGGSVPGGGVSGGGAPLHAHQRIEIYYPELSEEPTAVIDRPTAAQLRWDRERERKTGSRSTRASRFRAGLGTATLGTATLGTTALALGALTALLVVIGINLAVGDDFAASTAVGVIAVGVSIAGFLLGGVAVITRRGRLLGVVAVVVCVLANPVVLTRLLDFATAVLVS